MYSPNAGIAVDVTPKRQRPQPLERRGPVLGGAALPLESVLSDSSTRKIISFTGFVAKYDLPPLRPARSRRSWSARKRGRPRAPLLHRSSLGATADLTRLKPQPPSGALTQNSRSSPPPWSVRRWR